MFRVNIADQDGWSKVELEDAQAGNKVEVLPRAGAILNAFHLNTPDGPVNVIDGYQSREDFEQRVTQGFRSAKLSPFVCRLNQSTYSWKGAEYKLDNKFVLNGSALHGILYDAAFDIIESTSSDDSCSVTMRYQYDGDLTGYPFPYNCTVRYCLGVGGKLTIQTHLSNPAAAKQAIPISDGWHPYFKLGGQVDDWWLEMASDQMLEYDQALIPTGKYVTNAAFYPGRKIGGISLDNGFLLRENISPICVLRNESLTVEFIRVKNYPYLQLYIPGSRDSIAIENLSAAPDAFNNGMGLTILEPGEKIDYETVIKIS
ncbi:MAG TPA: aldose 1-epimerase [Chitinophagaceae bacterium]|nr:aldose 1-epimerase [Chitinophagaceae bacterium]